MKRIAIPGKIAAALALGAWLALAAAPAPAAEHERGREIYNYRCYFCHGYSGDARTLAATFLDPAPRDFTAPAAAGLERAYMIDVVTRGKVGTAMHGFARLLTVDDTAAVVDFVRREFIREQRANTRYHTAANGWADHARYRAAAPFADGSIALDTPWQELTPDEVRGKRLYLSACITCHDRARVTDEGEIWRKQSVSFPRNNYSHTEPDAISAASVYALHDRPPTTAGLPAEAIEGAALWRQNCEFCHAADGSGQNWIGSFLEPPPRDLTDPRFMRRMNRERLRQRIRDGLANTSMPAWKSVLSEREIDRIISYIEAAFNPLGDG